MFSYSLWAEVCVMPKYGASRVQRLKDRYSAAISWQAVEKC